MSGGRTDHGRRRHGRTQRKRLAAARFVARLRDAWPVRAIVAGAIVSATDYVTLIALVRFAHFVPVIASIIGVVVGGSVGFVLNKYVAFRNRDKRVGRQAFLYATIIGLSLLVYAGFYYALTEYLRMNYVLAKLLSDFVVFGVGGLVTNRFLVFPEKERGHH